MKRTLTILVVIAVAAVPLAAGTAFARPVATYGETTIASNGDPPEDPGNNASEVPGVGRPSCIPPQDPGGGPPPCIPPDRGGGNGNGNGNAGNSDGGNGNAGDGSGSPPPEDPGKNGDEVPGVGRPPCIPPQNPGGGPPSCIPPDRGGGGGNGGNGGSGGGNGGMQSASDGTTVLSGVFGLF